MEFVYGTGAIVASISLLAFAKYAIGRYESSSWISRFAATEVMALLITTMTAFGIAFICDGIASHDFNIIMVELGASLGVIALSVVAMARLFRRPSASVTAVAAKRPATT